jgi:flavin-dependent dehydrogenase
MSERYDVVVIGGGPAGSLVASLVRRQDPGRRVLVLERDVFPRYHVGESTIPSWAPVLERAGVLEKLEASDAIRKVGGRFFWGVADDESWTIDFRDPKRQQARRGGFHVDRAAFDTLLLDHARSLGVDVRQPARVESVERLADGTRITWSEGDTRESAEAAWVVDASGQARVLARAWELGVEPFDGMNNFAVCGYWKGSGRAQHGAAVGPHERWTSITTTDDGWVWHIPIAEDLVSVGVVTDAEAIPRGGAPALEEFYLRNVRHAEEVRELLEHATLDAHPLAPSKLVVVRDWSYRTKRLAGEGWLLVGDAALFVDPILSTGLLITTHAASMAANLLSTVWNDADVDRSALFDAYDTTYTDIGLSFHRLASIWYSRNFKRSTWHWEAKRQRLRTGRDPEEESEAEAFYELCIGSFANPLEGAAQSPARPPGVERPDVEVMGSHLFTRAERAKIGKDASLTGDEPEHALATALRARGDERLTALLDLRVKATGCVWTTRESYFTDGESTRWSRVRFVELRPSDRGEAFDRVVFAWASWLPEGLPSLLEGRRTLREIFADACSAARPGPSTHERMRALRRQVLQMDMRGWLAIT